MENYRQTELRILRAKKHMTQADLAKKVGISLPAYALIEQGKRDGSRKTWLKIQEALKLEDGKVWKLYANR